MTDKIQKDMTFAKALEISGQEGAQVMAKYGLHCIGCHIAATASIAEGCNAHGLSAEDADKMVDAINDIMAKAAKKEEE